MKIHTNDLKNNIKNIGRVLDDKITYTINNQEYELDGEQINSISPHYESELLKSVMKQLDIDTNIEIPIGTIINYQIGVRINNQFEYLDYGNYIVYSIEKQEDLRSYKIVCYDKMLYAMKDYEALQITYPITIKNYINAICSYLGLTFANINDTFPNYNKEIQNELYLGENGTSLGFTFRDVLDQLAEVTASNICINENDELELRYINETNDTIDEEFLKDVNVNFGEKFGPVNSIVLSRAGESDNVYLRDEESVEQDGLCEIKIVENQIMNFNDRSDFLPDILNQLDGLEYYVNDYSSTGICYYELCDKYNIAIGNNIYSCIVFNDEVNRTQGLVENIYTPLPEKSETDYKKADKTDRRINQAYIIVNKQNQTIEALTSAVQEVEREENNNYQELLDKFQSIDENITDISELKNTVIQLQTDTYTKTEVQQIANGTGVDGVKVSAVISTSGTFDENGMTYEKTNAPTKTTINETGVNVKDSSNNSLLFAGYVNSTNTDYPDYEGQTIVGTDNIIVKKYLNIGSHSRIQDYDNGTGIFYM